MVARIDVSGGEPPNESHMAGSASSIRRVVWCSALKMMHCTWGNLLWRLEADARKHG